MLPDFVEIKRLEAVYRDASNTRSQAATKINELQVEIATQRASFFEKLTIGSGAAIAAIVSYLGSGSHHLYPHWAMRCSLVALVSAMIAGLYRDYRYPYYVLSVRKRVWLEAEREMQRSKNNYLLASPNPIDFDTGHPIDKIESNEEFKDSDAKLQVTIPEVTKDEERYLMEWTTAERVCLIAIGVAMICLVWIALETF